MDGRGPYSLRTPERQTWIYRWSNFDVYEYENDDNHCFLAVHTWNRANVIFEAIPIDVWELMGELEQGRFRVGFIGSKKPDPEKRFVLWEGCDTKWAEKHPALWEFLSATAYGDGSERQTSTLSWFIGREGCTIVLQDRDVGRSLWASAPTWEQALRILEQQAQKGPTAPWRADKRDTGKTARLERPAR